LGEMADQKMVNAKAVRKTVEGDEEIGAFLRHVAARISTMLDILYDGDFMEIRIERRDGNAILQLHSVHTDDGEDEVKGILQ
jgi:hypothetical protein